MWLRLAKREIGSSSRKPIEKSCRAQCTSIHKRKKQQAKERTPPNSSLQQCPAHSPRTNVSSSPGPPTSLKKASPAPKRKQKGAGTGKNFTEPGTRTQTPEDIGNQIKNLNPTRLPLRQLSTYSNCFPFNTDFIQIGADSNSRWATALNIDSISFPSQNFKSLPGQPRNPECQRRAWAPQVTFGADMASKRLISCFSLLGLSESIHSRPCTNRKLELQVG